MLTKHNLYYYFNCDNKHSAFFTHILNLISLINSTNNTFIIE